MRCCALLVQLELLPSKVPADLLTFQEAMSEIRPSTVTDRSDCSQQDALDASVSLSGFSLDTCV